jgi:sulfate permease, SulP family
MTERSSPWWRRLLPWWAVGYPRAWLRDDLSAGLVLAVMLVPQAMAYASLAGMPPITGLYAAVVALLAYAWIGSSSHLSFGPVAIVALLTASALDPLARGRRRGTSPSQACSPCWSARSTWCWRSSVRQRSWR